eukprot:jgi/Ulvmu1/6433/UM003_0062.1
MADLYNCPGWRPGGAPAVVPGGPTGTTLMSYGSSGRKLTTTQRANAAVEQYWARKKNQGQEHPLSDRCPSKSASPTRPCKAGALPGREPGGEAEIAARVKHEGRSARVDLGNGNNFFAPSYCGTPRDLSEKERPQGRGIPGFTGTTPAPHLRAPVKPLEDPSATYAINAYDQRRPWTSGVRGYTGHQLPPQYQGRNERSAAAFENAELLAPGPDGTGTQRGGRPSSRHEQLRAASGHDGKCALGGPRGAPSGLPPGYHQDRGHTPPFRAPQHPQYAGGPVDGGGRGAAASPHRHQAEPEHSAHVHWQSQHGQHGSPDMLSPSPQQLAERLNDVHFFDQGAPAQPGPAAYCGEMQTGWQGQPPRGVSPAHGGRGERKSEWQGQPPRGVSPVPSGCSVVRDAWQGRGGYGSMQHAGAGGAAMHGGGASHNYDASHDSHAQAGAHGNEQQHCPAGRQMDGRGAAPHSGKSGRYDGMHGRAGPERPQSAVAVAGARGHRGPGQPSDGLTACAQQGAAGRAARVVDRDTQTAESCMLRRAELAAQERQYGVKFGHGVLPKPMW